MYKASFTNPPPPRESCARIRGGEPSADGARVNIVTRSRVEFKPPSSVGTLLYTRYRYVCVHITQYTRIRVGGGDDTTLGRLVVLQI